MTNLLVCGGANRVRYVSLASSIEEGNLDLGRLIARGDAAYGFECCFEVAEEEESAISLASSTRSYAIASIVFGSNCDKNSVNLA